jgi:RNA polymerase sigma factor (TIGR02999 family)
MAETPQGLTVILERARDGDARARDELVALIYDELRRVASRLMRRERPDHTLAPTAVVHEAVIRLLGEGLFDRAADRTFLFAAAARAMREVLIDHARRRAAGRRGGAGGASHSMPWWTTLRGRGWTSSRSTRRSTGWPSWTGGRPR